MRGSIRRRGKTSWELKFDAPTDNGLRKTRYVSFKGSRQDAQRELTRLLGQLDAGVLADPSNVTVAQYLEAWLRGPIGSPKTIERYGELLKNQIAPHLGTIRLQKLRPEHIRKWHNDLRETGLAPATVRHAHKLLNRILVDALKAGVVSRNVASVFRPPAVEQVEIEILTAEQVTEVLTALAGHWLHPIVALALATGARRGELLALQWGDVNLDAGTLRIERSVEETKAGLRIKAPKTRRGKRTITLPLETISLLRDHKVTQLQARLVLGMGKPDNTTLVFSDVEGELLLPHTVSRAWRRIVAAKGLPAVTFHALRHTHASMLIHAGVDVLTISRRLGHSKAAITLDVYGHLMPGADEAAAVAIGKVLK